MSDEYRETHSWEGVKTANDHFELIVLNDTREAWKGSWKVERVTLNGEVLAAQSFDVELDAVSTLACRSPKKSSPTGMPATSWS